MSPPVQPPVRTGKVRRATVGVLSGSAVVGALTMAGAPWEAVVSTVAGTLVVSLVLGLAQIVMPEESEHKRDLLLEWLRHRERRTKPRARRPARRTSGTGSRR
ncbi:hypothetical protein [Streptomyces mirabilis]|uniref:Uncharacterized protein n=1 Tax=Streptomyces mirabilis TaxID=68239 RepID=A0A1I2VL82_9ACTN|nr:hypothetical protein [Streptomyces mirabilis]SFG89890.1 hypothetical protein SAMN02787118_13258 [Streptomyces mirabilis]